ncbi:MAG: hypothetical protein RSA99_02805, partial [Oscillospiraceae bacterium]
MPIIISNILIGVNEPDEAALTKAIKKLNIDKERITKSFIYKKSLDARDKTHIRFVVSVMMELQGREFEAVKNADDASVVYKKKNVLEFKMGEK